MHDGLLGAGDGLVRATDERFASLGQHLNDDVVGDQAFVDDVTHEIKICLAGGWESNLDLFVAHVHQEGEHGQLASGIHGIDQGLVAIAQIHGTPLRCS